jgi:hypothetical protein
MDQTLVRVEPAALGAELHAGQSRQQVVVSARGARNLPQLVVAVVK